jgi:putative Mg2+ transporter-C (MgtC) family protein
LYFAAAATTVLAIIILWALQPIEKKFLKKFRHVTLRIVASQELSHAEILAYITKNPALKISSFTIDKEDSLNNVLINFEQSKMELFQELFEELKKNNAIKEIHWNQ